MDAWNLDYFDKIWCKNVCQAKWSSFIFKLPEFSFSISRSWRLWDKFLFFIGETEQEIEIQLKLNLRPHVTELSFWNCLQNCVVNVAKSAKFWWDSNWMQINWVRNVAKIDEAQKMSTKLVCVAWKAGAQGGHEHTVSC